MDKRRAAAGSAEGAKAPARQSGFTLMEMLLVAMLIGLFAGVAVVQVTKTMKRGEMSKLKHDLRVMRDLIQQYKVDKKNYPEELESLVTDGYMRVMPIDPITESAETWIPIYNEPDPDADELPNHLDTDSDGDGILDGF